MTSQASMCILLAILVASCLSMPMMSEPQASDAAVAPRNAAAPSELSRRDLLNSLSQEQRHYLLKAFPDAFTDLSNQDLFWHELAPLHPVHDRDYEGWMDFGRRNVDDLPRNS
ncbi:gastrin/cholecystokinin-like peptide [Ambystoma mexicanum]|uniref:gastrin/cholecystokinin-like peptide n=1 Tax=Ambystoma mexicanum TaxID=8296 RepID=UPI0037E9B322